jgi:hypothetical protein
VKLMQFKSYIVGAVTAGLFVVGLAYVRTQLGREWLIDPPLRNAVADVVMEAEVQPAIRAGSTPAELLATRFPSHSHGLVTRFYEVTEALSAKDGFLGKRLAVSTEGNQLIAFLWFRDVKSARRWYHDKLRKDVLEPYLPELARHTIQAAPSNQPIVLLATLTPNPNGVLAAGEPSIVQASFEVLKSSAEASLGSPFGPQKATAAVASRPSSRGFLSKRS